MSIYVVHWTTVDTDGALFTITKGVFSTLAKALDYLDDLSDQDKTELGSSQGGISNHTLDGAQ